MIALLLAMQTMAIDWAKLPPLSYRVPPQVAPAMNAYVARQVTSPRCALPKANKDSGALALDIAVLVDADGQVRAAIPRAIQCPVIEQYAAGLVTSFARNNIAAGVTSDGWFRTSITFTWHQ